MDICDVKKKIRNYILFFLILLVLSGCYTEGINEPDYMSEPDSLQYFVPKNFNLLTGLYRIQINGKSISLILIFKGSRLSIISNDLTNSQLLYFEENRNTEYRGYQKPILSVSPFKNISILIPDTLRSDLTRGILPKEFNLIEIIADNRRIDTMMLDYQGPLRMDADFLIVGHRGGSAENTSIPAPENSLSICNLAVLNGANGIELDVRLTRDRIPVCFHDENLTPRTVESQICIGPISNYYYEHLKAFARLYNGESIPTLEEMLEKLVKLDGLSLVWLDVKDASFVDSIIVVQIKYNDISRISGKSMKIYLGLPSEDIYQAYMKSPLKKSSPSICELSPDEAISSGANYWAPRWTLGILENDIVRLKNLGIKTIFWTVNEADVIEMIINKTSASGILTDYPAYVYMKKYAYHK
jgi:glycerophosphoryl diester phosphodiesterase